MLLLLLLLPAASASPRDLGWLLPPGGIPTTRAWWRADTAHGWGMMEIVPHVMESVVNKMVDRVVMAEAQHRVESAVRKTCRSRKRCNSATVGLDEGLVSRRRSFPFPIEVGDLVFCNVLNVGFCLLIIRVSACEFPHRNGPVINRTSEPGFALTGIAIEMLVAFFSKSTIFYRTMPGFANDGTTVRSKGARERIAL